MEIKVEYRPSYALAIVGLGTNESIVAEGGAMVSMSSNMSIKTSRGAASGGLLKSLKRAVLGGESFFMNTFTANGGAGEITLAPTLPGDIQTLTMTGPSLMIQSTSYLASSPGITLDTKWGGMKTLFGGEGLFMLKATGQGQVIVNSFGAIHEIPISGPYIVDSGHIVAFEETLTFEVKKVGSWKATLLSGEGLVCLFNGKGRLWIQSRNPKAFGGLVGHKLPPRES